MGLDGIDNVFNKGMTVKLESHGKKKSGITFELKSIFAELAKKGVIKDLNNDGFTAADAKNLFAKLNEIHEQNNLSTDYGNMSEGDKFTYDKEQMLELAKAAGYEVVEQEETNEPLNQVPDEASSSVQNQSSTPATPPAPAPAPVQTVQNNNITPEQKADFDNVLKSMPFADKIPDKDDLKQNGFGQNQIKTVTLPNGKKMDFALNKDENGLYYQLDRDFGRTYTNEKGERVRIASIPDAQGVFNKTQVTTIKDGLAQNVYYDKNGKPIEGSIRKTNVDGSITKYSFTYESGKLVLSKVSQESKPAETNQSAKPQYTYVDDAKLPEGCTSKYENGVSTVYDKNGHKLMEREYASMLGPHDKQTYNTTYYNPDGSVQGTAECSIDDDGYIAYNFKDADGNAVGSAKVAGGRSEIIITDADGKELEHINTHMMTKEMTSQTMNDMFKVFPFKKGEQSVEGVSNSVADAAGIEPSNTPIDERLRYMMQNLANLKPQLIPVQDTSVQQIPLPENFSELLENSWSSDGLSSIYDESINNLSKYSSLEKSMTTVQKVEASNLYNQFIKDEPVTSFEDGSLGIVYRKAGFCSTSKVTLNNNIKPFGQMACNILTLGKSRYLELLQGEKDINAFQDAGKTKNIKQEDWNFLVSYNYWLEGLGIEVNQQGEFVKKSGS